MSDTVFRFRTAIPPEEVVVRAVQFFSSTKWRPTGQSSRTATFQGMPPIPWTLMLLTVLGFVFCVVPGIICYIFLIQKARQFQNLVVTASPVSGGSDVLINYPIFATDVVSRFTQSLPHLESPSTDSVEIKDDSNTVNEPPLEADGEQLQ
jgi:hypothetical protein